MTFSPIELTISDITRANRRMKVLMTAHALSEHMGLDAVIEDLTLEKTMTHKYVSKKLVNGQWVYTYPQSEQERRANTASQLTDIMTGIQPLTLRSNNAVKQGKAYLRKILQYLRNHDVRCKWAQNRKVTGVDINHLTVKMGNLRALGDIINHAKFLPFVLPIIQKYGHVSTVRKDGRGCYSYELVGKARLPDGKLYAISVILREYQPGKGLELEHRSVFGFTNKLIKSLAVAHDPTPVGTGVTSLPVLQASRLGIGKAALSKGRGNPAFHLGTDNPTDGVGHLPLIISDISVQSIDPFPNIELSIHHITAENRKEKFAKAMRAVSRALKVPVSLERKKAGEPYFYGIQQELSDRWTRFYEGLLKQVYAAVCAALDLPRVEVETLRKALDDGVLKYRKKVIYHPETGQPLKKRDFDDLIMALERFLNRVTKDTGKRITLDGVTIGKLLRRIAKYQASGAMRSLRLDEARYRGKTFDWIRRDIRNLKGVLGKPLSGPEMARYQAAEDYVANLVTRSNNKIRDDIKEVVLNGILEKRSKSQVSQDLFNRLGSHNRDWKRIADTELVNTANLAGIWEEVNNAAPGEKVYFQRYELAGCCDTCAPLNGQIVLWSDTPLDTEKIQDPYAKVALWEGKRSEKGKAVLVTGTIHPNCRGGWVRWGGSQVDAMVAELRGKTKPWDDAIAQARAEYRERGIANPHDQTAGYTERITELYQEKIRG